MTKEKPKRGDLIAADNVLGYGDSFYFRGHSLTFEEIKEGISRNFDIDYYGFEDMPTSFKLVGEHHYRFVWDWYENMRILHPAKKGRRGAFPASEVKLFWGKLDGTE